MIFNRNFLASRPAACSSRSRASDGFLLYRGRSRKREPKLDDPGVRCRIEERILERHFADLTSSRIRWESCRTGTS